MHRLGYVIMGFVIVLAIAAIILSARALQIRNHWLKQVEDSRVKAETALVELAKEQEQTDKVNEAADLARNLWGTSWLAPNCGPVDAAQGTVQLSIGKNQGLAAAELAQQQALPIIFAFSVDQNGTSNYIGEFQLEQVADNSATAKLTRLPFNGEQIPAGTWRIRQRVNFGEANAFKEMFAERVRLETNLRRDLYNIARDEKQLASSTEIYEERRKELEGNPDLADATELQRIGLVEGIRQSLTQRDALQERLDYLRRRLDFTYRQVEEVLDRNATRAGSLPGSSEPYNPPAAGPAAAATVAPRS